MVNEDLSRYSNKIEIECGPMPNLMISAVSEPKFTILSGHVAEVLLLNKFFFRLSIHALVAKI